MTARQVDIFFVGIGKCGTSWIYEFMRRHDIIATPTIKEPYLVDVDAQRRENLIAQLYTPKADQPLADFSNVYYWDPDNPSKIKAVNPDARIVITTRRPSERIISHFGFLQRNGIVPVDQTLESYLEAGDSERLVARTDYDAIIARYEAVFDKEQILVLPLELLKRDAQAYADQLLGFLKIPSITLRDEDRLPVLQAARARSRFLARTAKVMANFLRTAGALSLLGRLKQAKTIRKLLYKPVANQAPTTFGPATNQIRAFDQAYPDLIAKWGYTFLTA